jgi:3-phosphoshikimate 1-carboxyvinyltransferase
MQGGELRIDLPRSKSIANRLLVMNALSRGAVDVTDFGTADDTRLLHEALHSSTGEMYMGHAGTAMRFGLAYAAVSPGERLLHGSDRLHERPIAPLVDALRSLGADITYVKREGFAPLRVHGRKLKGGGLSLDATVSSQFITALMLVGPYLSGGLDLLLSGNAVSTPYLRMTASLMREAGADVSFEGKQIQIGEVPYADCSIEAEADWSAASYFYSAVALNPALEITLHGLQERSLQGDAVVAKLYHRFGVESRFNANGVTLSAMDIFDDSLEMNFLECPDLAQTVAVTAAGMRIPLKLTGLQTLRVKETDRIAALAAELQKCGVGCSAESDSLHLKHFADVDATPHIRTYHDHRMAMAFAPLTFALGEMLIEDPAVVSKSFPEFWQEMGKMLGIVQ